MNEYQHGLLLGWLTGGAVGILFGLGVGLLHHARRCIVCRADVFRLQSEVCPHE